MPQSNPRDYYLLLDKSLPLIAEYKTNKIKKTLTSFIYFSSVPKFVAFIIFSRSVVFSVIFHPRQLCVGDPLFHIARKLSWARIGMIVDDAISKPEVWPNKIRATGDSAVYVHHRPFFFSLFGTLLIVVIIIYTNSCYLL